VLLLCWIGVTYAQHATHGDVLLGPFVLALGGGLLACLGTGAALPVARLLNGGAAVFVSGVMFAQVTYIAAEYDRFPVLQSLALLGLVLVANTAVAEARLARARRRADVEAAHLAATRHAELLAALRSIDGTQSGPARRQARPTRLFLRWRR